MKLLELGELDHVVIARARLAWGQAEHDPVQDDVVARGEVRIEADAELDKRRHPAAYPDVSAIGRVDPGETFQQRALAAAVASDDAEELALPDFERHVLERLERVMSGAAQWM